MPRIENQPTQAVGFENKQVPTVSVADMKVNNVAMSAFKAFVEVLVKFATLIAAFFQKVFGKKMIVQVNSAENAAPSANASRLEHNKKTLEKLYELQFGPRPANNQKPVQEAPKKINLNSEAEFPSLS